jgi:hypothetical protein
MTERGHRLLRQEFGGVKFKIDHGLIQLAGKETRGKPDRFLRGNPRPNRVPAGCSTRERVKLTGLSPTRFLLRQRINS